MDARIEKLFEAHVAHELQSFSGKGLEKTIRGEVAAVFAQLADIRLADIATPKQIMGIIQRVVIEMPISGGISELAGEMARKVLSSVINESTQLEDIYPKSIYDEFVDKIASLENVRHRIIHRAVHNQAYYRLVSDAVFTTVAEWAQAPKSLAKKIPGMGRVSDLGSLLSSIAMPSLLETVEETLRHTVEKGLGSVAASSEELLREFMDEDRMVEIADATWEHVGHKTLAEHFSAIDPVDLDDLIVIGLDFWLHFRTTEFFAGICKELVEYFFEKYGNSGLDVLLDDVGVDEKMATREVMELIKPAMKKITKTGLLEDRIRARLLPFYQSLEAAKILGFASASADALQADAPAVKEKSAPAQKTSLAKKPARATAAKKTDKALKKTAPKKAKPAAKKKIQPEE
ncbi:MAG: hypothetical protein QMD09_03085 [Desulfatibacillaceae bacterium]|nr:hypothetical protein [Desulfatibacillaceae bacterium]